MCAKEVPVLFLNKEECAGCSACALICPCNAISMEPDEYGFLYPSIVSASCVGCERCVDVCPLKRSKKE